MKLQVGASAEIKKAFTDSDVKEFASLSLDDNPLHLDEAFASTTLFKKRIVHGFLVGSLISAVLAKKVPGPGSIYLSQDMKFKKPVYLGDEVTARVTVESIRPDKGIFNLKTECLVDGVAVVEGSAVIMNASC